jgi:hypothetical protein
MILLETKVFNNVITIESNNFNIYFFKKISVILFYLSSLTINNSKYKFTDIKIKSMIT